MGTVPFWTQVTAHGDHHHHHHNHDDDDDGVFEFRGCGAEEPTMEELQQDEEQMIRWKDDRIHRLEASRIRAQRQRSRIGTLRDSLFRTTTTTFSSSTLDPPPSSRQQQQQDKQTKAASANEKATTTTTLANTTTTVRHTNARTSALESRLVTIGPDCIRCIQLDLYFHVLENTTLSWSVQQRLDLEMVNQYDALSAAFSRTPFKFSFGGTRHYVVDNVLASTNTRGRPDLEDAIGLRFRVGGADTLNVYWSRGLCREGMLGYTYVPARTAGIYPDGAYNPRDGIYMCLDARRGSGVFEHFDQGKTLAHEVGHWLGLYHTFRGHSCADSNENDLVDDTPAQAGPTNGCPSQRDSCPDREGLDNVRNYMDYSWDVCMDHFTPGQSERMYAQVDLYRRRLEPCNSLNESTVVFQVRLDDYPNQTNVRYIDWKTLANTRLMGDPDTYDFARRTVTRTVCVPIDRLHEFRITDTRLDGIQPPGFYALSINNRQVLRGDLFSRQLVSHFFVADVTECDDDQVRFTLEILMDGNLPSTPSTTWFLRNNDKEEEEDDDKVVVDYTDTLMDGFSDYSVNFLRAHLFVDKCLAGGSYTFHMAGHTIQHYIVKVDGVEIKAGWKGNGETTAFRVRVNGSSSPPGRGGSPVLSPALSPIYIFGSERTVAPTMEATGPSLAPSSPFQESPPSVSPTVSLEHPSQQPTIPQLSAAPSQHPSRRVVLSSTPSLRALDPATDPSTDVPSVGPSQEPSVSSVPSLRPSLSDAPSSSPS